MKKAIEEKEKETPKETRQRKQVYVGNAIMEVSASTKRKPAYLKVAIPDDLANKIMRNHFFGHVDGFPKIMALYLNYEENLTPEE